MKLTIPGTLPSLNKVLEEAKGHWSKYRVLKENCTEFVAWHANELPALNYADYTFTWYCQDKRQDKDNIMSAQKFVFDGLQMAGKIKNDGWKQIRNISHRFEIDKYNPRVEIEIVEVVSA